MGSEWPDSNTESLNSDQMQAWAEDHGMAILFPAPDELFIDIDNKESLQEFRESFALLRRMYDSQASYVKAESKTEDGEHWHIIVKLSKPVSAIERLALQAAMGSDNKRELLGYIRYKANDPKPTMFAEQL